MNLRTFRSGSLRLALAAAAVSGSFFFLSAIAQKKGIDPEGITTAPGLETKRYIGPLQDAYDRIDPSKDGWESEGISTEANLQLDLLREYLEEFPKPRPETLAALLSPTFTVQDLRPASFTINFERDGMTVRRMKDQPVARPKLQGPAGLAKVIADWFGQAGLSAAHHPAVKLKLWRIEKESDTSAVTQVICTVKGYNSKDRRQVNSYWTCRWDLASDSEDQDVNVRLKSITLDTYEEVVIAGRKGKPLLQDATASLLGRTKAYQEQFLHGTDHWRLRIPRDFGLDVVANHGLAIGDINGDGLEDLYICQQGGLPNRLFLRNPDGTLRDYTAESNTGWLDYCAAALIVDLDNDGDKDLVISQDFKILFMDNVDGRGHFELAFGMGTKAQSFSLTAADYNEDGLLDVYICGYNPSGSEERSGAMGEPLPFHDANNGGPNILWHNTGRWEFIDVTDRLGLEVNNTRFSFAASWEDYDNDGDLDLYVANDYGRNNLYQNQGALGGYRFVDVAPALQVEDTSAGMSSNWADFNRDGWMDLYVSNMFSGAGNRITYQNQFQEAVDDKVRAQFQRMARGNTLFQADGKGGFVDLSLEAGVNQGRWSWGSGFVDLNNDGWDDILAANGFITTEDTGDL